MNAPHWLSFALAIIPMVTFAPSASAQKVEKKFFEMPEYGFRFKGLEDFKRIPPQENEKEFGIVGKMEGKEVGIPIKGSGVYNFNVGINIYRFADQELDIKVNDKKDKIDIERLKLEDYVGMSFRGVNSKDTLIDETFKVSKTLNARHRQWMGSVYDGDGKFLLDCYSFDLPDADVHVVYSVPDKHRKKWEKFFQKSIKTFELIEVVENNVDPDKMTYEELLAWHDTNQRDVGGWRAVPSPSKRYIIKTDSDDKDFINDVIARLEKSRDLFEVDFPPKEDFRHVSIVRVCSTEEIFHSYGSTSPGVAGWFSPASTELVLYDGKNRNRNMTYSVMTHEAFHQYCFFLFHKSEAHRWFDEGHGDYYGGAKMGRSMNSPMEITNQMPAGLDRLSVIREMVRTKTYAPISEHLNYNHSQWQNQGPTGVSCYAQSWSIIYFLRQGSLGKVPSKVWRPEYATIIPNYIATLSQEYIEAYARARKEALKKKGGKTSGDKPKEEDPGKAEPGGDDSGKGTDGEDGAPGKDGEDGGGASEDDGEEISVVIGNDDIFISEREKKKIWEKSIEASWGQVDLDQFERDWLAYVTDHL